MSKSRVAIGELNHEDLLYTQGFEWKIPNFNSTNCDRCSSIVSPSFTYVNNTLHLVLSENNFAFLCLSEEHPISRDIKSIFSLKTTGFGFVGHKWFTLVKGKTTTEKPGFNVQEAVMKHQNENVLSPTNELTIGCGLQISVREETEIKSTTEPLDCLRLTEDGAFYKGLKDMLLNNKYSDFVLNVRGKEFRAHRNILAARSPVFAAMFEHDMKEKRQNSVDIEDCEPDIFSEFLNFLYAGEIENFNSDHALDLYEVADKYQVTELGNLCVQYMMNNISVENILDILNLGLRFYVQELIDVATQFFLQNSKEIAVTAKWITFLGKNPVAGNELFLKALDLKK